MQLKNEHDAIIDKGPYKLENKIWVFKEFMTTNMLTYKVLIGPDKMRWVVPVDSDNAALYIFKELDAEPKHPVKNPIKRYVFKTDEGYDLGLFDVVHSDAHSLLRATGYDVVGQVYNYRVTAFNRSMTRKHELVFHNVLIKETVLEKTAISIEHIAKTQANFYRKEVFWATKNEHSTKTGVCFPEVIK